jgi:hypothetical protein
VEELDELDWQAIGANDFRSAEVKEPKQAEFLVHQRVPFDLVERIGVRSAAVHAQVVAALAGGPHRPPVAIVPQWYF